MGPGDFGALGFWIFIASIVVGSFWSKSRREAEKHETLRRIVEKTGEIDEAKLKELFSPAEDPKSDTGDSYRILRAVGTIIMFVGAGIATFVLIAVGLGKVFGGTRLLDDITGLTAMLGVSAGVAMLGLGIFFSSRFCEPPPGARSEPPAR